MYASSISVETRQTPRRPIFTAASWPLRMSVYTCATATFRTLATSSGRRNLGTSSTARLLGHARDLFGVGSTTVATSGRRP